MLATIHAAEFIQYLSWAIFILIGLQTSFQAVRRPTPVNIHSGILFGGLALAIAVTAAIRLGLLPPSRLVQSLVGMTLVAMPYLLFRLMDDVIGVPRLLHGFVALAFLSWVALVWMMPSSLPQEQLCFSW